MLHVVDYGLFPGTEPDRGGLTVTFEPGLTVVLGANGLGKTTLVWILYRLLSGPYDITSLDDGGDLGRRNLEPRKLGRQKQQIFARRVTDGAKNATATLSFHLGGHSVSVARRLSNLELIEFRVDDEERQTNGEESYQVAIAEMAGLWSFGDWILLLRHLTFYFEDRRELVWDPTAQREILRFLFLPAATARKWTETEREILSQDSRVRNLNAAVSREEHELTQSEELKDASLDVREELKSLSSLQRTDEQRRDELDQQILELDAERKAARLAFLKAEQEREAEFRDLEHAKLVALKDRFPSASETARYILAQLLTESECLACGNRVPEVARVLESRLVDSKCVVCGSKLALAAARSAETAMLSNERVTRRAQTLDQADAAVSAARAATQDADDRYNNIWRQLQELDSAVARRRERIDALIRRLPKEEAELHQQRQELALMRSRVASLKDELVTRRNAFAAFIEEVRGSLFERAPVIKELFESYARDFLFEDCSLVWSPRKEPVGQTGIAIEYPAFELEMASASFHSPVRRTGPEQVSESQREFIDLSFRMALMAAADTQSGGTLVMDAPESSLDAVFVQRAADVLARFAVPKSGNRLIVTSNLTNGDLIPRLLTKFRGEWKRRMVDLFEVAEPTAAVRELKGEYTAVKNRVFSELSTTKDGT
jgi:predicted ATP-binding protein involved in virulence